MPIDLSRRKLITGMVASLVTAPSIVRASSLMKVKGVDLYNISIDDRALKRMYEKLFLNSMYGKLGRFDVGQLLSFDACGDFVITSVTPDDYYKDKIESYPTFNDYNKQIMIKEND